MDLIEFLRKQLDNDEAFAHGWHGGGSEYIGSGFPADPARMLVEVDAKRRVVDVLELARGSAFPADAWVLVREAVRELAQPYRDHPDFDPSWLAPEAYRQRWVMGAEERG